VDRLARAHSRTGEANVHVDDHLGHFPRRSRLDRRFGVHRYGDARLSSDQAPETGGVEHLVGEQQVIGQTRRHHALDLPDGGAREVPVPGSGLHGSQTGALVGFDVWTQAVARQGCGHGCDVVLEVGALDEQGGRLQPGKGHGGSLGSGLTAGSPDRYRYGAIMSGVDARLPTDQET
jgi:hypothetical protein